MFTQCPHCQKSYTLTPAQLRDHRGMMRCEHCDTLFDELQFLRDTDDAELVITQETAPLPWEQARVTLSVYWSIALWLNLLLLLGQILYFEARGISQNPTLRPSLEKIASDLHQTLPLYQNVAELIVLHSRFEPQADNSRLLKLAIINQADFSQAYPKVKLSLLNEAGNLFSYRLFKPADYLPSALINTPLLADNSAEIELHIAAPQTAIAGYSVELLY